jgi:hypothetical protein
MTAEVIPHPGSFEAIARHRCTCDPFRNQFGRGLGESTTGVPVFEIHPGCEAHRPGSGWSPAGDVVLRRKREPVRSALPVPVERKKRPSRNPARCPGLPGEPCDRVEKLRLSGVCNRCHERRRMREKAKRARMAGAA